MPWAVRDGDKLFILLWWELARSEERAVRIETTAVRNFSKRVVWGDRKLNLNVCHRERGASGFMFRNHSLQRCNLLIGEREREIFSRRYLRDRKTWSPLKASSSCRYRLPRKAENIRLSWLISLSDEFENVRYAPPPRRRSHPDP